MKWILAFCLLGSSLALFPGGSSTSYDKYIDGRASWGEEMDRRHDEWFDAVMD